MSSVVKVTRKISANDAAKKIRATFPGIKVKNVYDYSGEWYMVMATDKDDVDYNSPYYLVGKVNGRVCSFSPLADLEQFSKALENEIAI